jgi:large-conductance mechanosensitive channel
MFNLTQIILLAISFVITCLFVYWIIKQVRKESERMGWDKKSHRPNSLLGG